ncbi:hypothetical protein [Streptosporangium sp. 'caverna']|uniref:hypothetical protein n=1 Tax=Streptosporangium sp. 'caverna' TaxID=2202249 RepID=UPI0013A68B79|nr:hypothetical protein [Streptosporangium sp. 'caverna']
MGDEARYVAIILQQVARLIKGLPSEDLEDLAKGRKKIIIEERTKRSKSITSGQIEASDLEQIREALSEFGERDSGKEYLNRLDLSKANLQELAYFMDLPIPKSDTIDSIKDRIIESTIGYKLRSQAIRGDDA